MKIMSYNVAGLIAMLKNPEFEEFCKGDYDILCFQDIKAEESELQLPEYLETKYCYKYYNSTKGTTERKGLSGVAIMSKIEPLTIIGYPTWDEEGRILALEFPEFILVNVYVPNSQKLESFRYYFRENWNVKLSTYISDITDIYKKEIIVCGNFNVAFFNNERQAFQNLLEVNKLQDIYIILHPTEQKSRYVSNFLEAERNKNNGWTIACYLVSQNIVAKIIKCEILMNIKGSDNCPIELIL